MQTPKFHTASQQERPSRLSAQTRQFAWESLQGKYGDLTVATQAVHLDHIPNFEAMPQLQQYDAAIVQIAKTAPIRICEHELVSGAATLGLAIQHQVPAMYNGKTLWSSVSHTTLGFDKVVREGLNATLDSIQKRLQQPSTPSHAQIEVLESMKNSIYAMEIWHKRYLDALAQTRPDICAVLQNVPFQPAANFHEAVQSLWFNFAFTRLCGNWPGIGRIDGLLWPYLKKDLEAGVQTIDSAREILTSFFIKGCEWVQSNPELGSGDAQHYQNIVLAGIDIHGNEITNPVTYLVLDIVEELGISDFPITVRINEKTPEALLTKIAQVMTHGGGVVAVYNESLIIDSLCKFGYPLEEARDFANDGCWEVQIPGKTKFSYIPIDSLNILLNDTLNLSGISANFDSMGQLYAAYVKAMEDRLEELYRDVVFHCTGREPTEEWQWPDDAVGDGDILWPGTAPCSVVSIYVEGCIESGRSYLNGGSKYTVVSPHLGGAPDVGNSLHAINKLVFEEKRVSFAQLMHILQNNWDGHEELRQYALNKLTYYGNDSAEADNYVAQVFDSFADIVAGLNGRCPIQFPPGSSTFGREIAWAPGRGAVPFGRKQGDILSGNASPTPSTDTEGATAIIKSYCKINHSKLTNGSALDIKLHPTAVAGANGVQALVALIKGFVQLGGFFMQLDIFDAEILRQAQQRPQDYKTLSVRISGWNARFVTLDALWQKMIIERTAQGF